MRINKYLSEAGLCSRREADRLIQEGRVTVEGVPARAGMQVEESAEVWDYGPGTAEDGMVFVYDEEETEWYMADDLD